jgi:hypothetical protein
VIAHTIFSTSSAIDEVTAELPILALIFTRKLRPMIIGSSFRVIDVGRNDRAPSRDLLADEFRRDEIRNVARRNLSPSRSMAVAPWRFAPEVLADGDELHLGRHDARPRIGKLGHRLASSSPSSGRWRTGKLRCQALRRWPTHCPRLARRRPA